MRPITQRVEHTSNASYHSTSRTHELCILSVLFQSLFIFLFQFLYRFAFAFFYFYSIFVLYYYSVSVIILFLSIIFLFYSISVLFFYFYFYTISILYRINESKCNACKMFYKYNMPMYYSISIHVMYTTTTTMWPIESHVRLDPSTSTA